MKRHLFLLIFSLSGGSLFAQFQNDLEIRFKGAGWYKFGKVMHASDTLTGGQENNYNGNWLQDAGALFNSVIRLSGNLEGSFGIGAVQKHHAQGSLTQAHKLTIGINGFVNMARLTYTMGENREAPPLQITTGLFSYKYDNNVKNLGLYLIRGAVYPGIILSSFEAKEMLPSANMLGGHVQNNFGPYTQDILLVSETDLYPKFDYSLLYIGTYQFGAFLELGGGINFYHLIPVRAELSSPSEEANFQWGDEITSTVNHKFNRYYAVDLDTVALADGTRKINRVWPSTRGVKLMSRLVFDPKPLFEADFLGKEDLKLYSEIAVLGLKNYERVYDNISERVPFMVGFNLPAFKLLNVLALEIEYFGSRHVPDYKKMVDRSSPIPQSPYKNRNPVDPANPGDPLSIPYDVDSDNWKWSFYFAKVLAGHAKISGQVACDHLRIGNGSNEEALTTLDDWYWMLKTTFFF